MGQPVTVGEGNLSDIWYYTAAGKARGPSRSRRTKTNAKVDRDLYVGRRLGRLGARIANVRQGDASMNSTREGWPRRERPLLGVFAGFGLGLLFLALGFIRPGIAAMRTVDLVYLVSTGAMLGAGLVWTRIWFGRRKG